MIATYDQADAPGMLPTHRERNRRTVVRLCLAIYCLVIFEGALRKWAFPQYQQIIFFLRDPLALCAMAIAYYTRLVTVSRYLLVVVVMGAALTVMAGLQVIGYGYHPLAAAYGLRNYLLYALLAGVIAQTFTRYDLLSIVRLTLYLGIPMAILSVAQYTSPASAAVNKSYSEGEIFTVLDGVVRTTGTFTFTSGMACFLASMFSFLAIGFYCRGERPLPSLVPLLVIACATATMLAVSGSRTAFTHAGLTVATVMLAEMVRAPQHRRPHVLVSIPILIALLGAFMALVFPDSLALLWKRQTNSTAQGENFFLRMLDMVFDGFSSIERTRVLGGGIGLLSPGGAALTGGSTFNSTEFGYAEYEFPRVVIESGVLGLCYMFLRWLLAIWLLVSSIWCIRRNNDMLPMMLWSATGVLITVSPMTSQGTANAYGWLFAGWTLAALATSRPRLTRTSTPRIPTLHVIEPRTVADVHQPI